MDDYVPNEADDYEKHSEYSIYNQSMYGNFAGLNDFTAANHNADNETINNDDMDEYIDQVLEQEKLKQQEKFTQFKQTNGVWKDFEIEHKAQMKGLLSEQWEADLNEIKNINKEQKILLPEQQKLVEESIGQS